MDRSESMAIVELAQRALADEWFAHYQYWIGSVVISDEWEVVISQLVEHSGDEYDHATELGVWLAKVPWEGTIPGSLPDVGSGKMFGCGYIRPMNDNPRTLVEDNLRGERCAIRFYTNFIEKVSTDDYYGTSLGRMLEEILKKEKEHAADLERLLRNL